MCPLRFLERVSHATLQGVPSLKKEVGLKKSMQSSSFLFFFLNNSLFALGSAYKWQQLIPSGRKVSNVHRRLCCVQNQRTVDHFDNFADGDADAS